MSKCKCCHTLLKCDISVLKTHQERVKHQNNSAKINHGSSKMLSQFLLPKSDHVVVEQTKHFELLLAGFFSEHNIPFLASDHMTNILKRGLPDSNIVKNLALGRTKITSIVKNVIAPCERATLAQKLSKRRFSVLIDETTDIGTVSTLCIIVRFFDEEKKQIISQFFKLINVFDEAIGNTGATAENIYKMLTSTFTCHNVPLENIIGFASDGCNTMMGAHNSVASRLRENFDGIVINKCLCHSLHLVVSQACKVLPRICEDMSRDIYNFFKNSAKRQTELKEFQHFCEVEPHKILKTSQTRWLSLLSVVKRILEQWSALELYFTRSALEDRMLSSQNILYALKNSLNKTYFNFLNWALPKIVQLNEYFQSEKVVISEVYPKMCSTYKDLIMCYMDPNYVNKTEIFLIDPENEEKFIKLDNIYLGVGVLELINELNMEEKKDFLIRCRNFLKTCASEILKRFDFKDSILKSICILDPKNKAKPPSIIELAKAIPRVSKNYSLQQLDNEWRNLFIIKSNPEIDSIVGVQIDQFWAELRILECLSGEKPFENIANFALDILCYPHSNAECERLFSKCNLIKTDIRNKLECDTIDALLLSSQATKKSCITFEPTTQMISRMNSANLYKKSADLVLTNIPTAGCSSASN